MENTQHFTTIAQAVYNDCPDERTYLRRMLTGIALSWLLIGLTVLVLINL